jgi:hypothetical protein
VFHDIVRACAEVAKESQFLSMEGSSRDMPDCVVVTWVPEELFQGPPNSADQMMQKLDPAADVDFVGGMVNEVEGVTLCPLCNKPVDGPPGSAHKACTDREMAEANRPNEAPQV